MESKIKNFLYTSIIIGIFAFIFLSVFYVYFYSKNIAPNRTFTVQGEGKIIAIPDIAEISVSIITEGEKNLSNLQRENSEKANKFISFLKEKGIDSKDIQTVSYNIQPRYKYFTCEAGVCPPPEIIGYSINQTIKVKIKDLNKIGEILEGVVKNGANNVSGPNFTIDDPLKLQDEAREKAILDAKERAKMIAKITGFKLGKIISINEIQSYPQPIFPLYELGGERVEEQPIAPKIEPGSQEIKVTVNLVYEIK